VLPGANEIVAAYVLSKLVWDEPSHQLIHHLGLVVDTFDREEGLSQRPCAHDVELPLGRQPRAVFDESRRNTAVGRKRGEEEDHTESIVDITDSINEGWIPEGIELSYVLQ
jgi:hypothetical protein